MGSLINIVDPEISCNTEILDLTVIPTTSNTTSVSACESYTWSVNGMTYSQSDTYTHGSDCTTDVLILTITPTTSNTTTASACDSYTWPVNGNTYTQSGIYTSVIGCATEILELSVITSISSTTNVTATGSYTWSVNGQTYTTSGTYSHATGCYTEVLNLTINVPCPPTVPPAIACYEIATWNTTTCSWDVTGTQPSQPSLACYETVTFNTTTCSWDVTGAQPDQPSLECYQFASFNTINCQWEIHGSLDTLIADEIACDIYTWNVTGADYTVTGTYSELHHDYLDPTDSINCVFHVLNLTIVPSVTYYFDSDSDGYGDITSTINSCSGVPPGYVAIFGDCDDLDSTIHPVADELCNSIDDNCDGIIDNGLVSVVSPGTIGGSLQSCRAGVAGSATFTVSGITTASGFLWTVPSGFNITSGQGTAALTVSYTANAIQSGIIGQVCALSTDFCGTTVLSCAKIDYQVVPPVTPPSISGASRLCVGDIATYSVASVSRASSYNWNLPAGMVAISGQGSNVITVSVSASYAGGIVSVSAANACGSSPLRTKAVTTNTPIAPGTISGPKTGLCNAGTVVYSISAVSGATSYLWSVSGGTLVSGQGGTSISVSFATFSSGSVSVQAVNACGASLVRSLAVYGSPARPGAIEGPVSVCLGDTVNFSVATVNGTGPWGYNWIVTFPGNIVSGQGTKNIWINWNNTSTSQTVVVGASNPCGSSPNNTLTGISSSLCSRVSHGSSILEMELYPNPAVDRSHYRFISDREDSFEIRVMDISGKTLLELDGMATIGLNEDEFDWGILQSGVYLIRFQVGQVVSTERLIISR
jgi:hypothetical protein